MTPEGAVKADIQDFLKKTGEFFLRLNSGKIRVGRRWIHLCPEGTPDFVVFRSKPCWIEVKGEGQRTKKERAEKQAYFAERVEELGHKHIQATSLEQVVEFLKEAA